LLYCQAIWSHPNLTNANDEKFAAVPITERFDLMKKFIATGLLGLVRAALLSALFVPGAGFAQGEMHASHARGHESVGVSKAWSADLGNGSFRNPVLYADYSDPDVVRVGDDFYLTASSFNAVPGLPILHSTDLVNWSIIGHALPRQPPFELFSHPQHGKGVWAPAIRHRNGEFIIYYSDPDFGIYRVTARSAAGPWSAPVLVKPAQGWIDPCPFWDDDGNAYLVHALAASRSGINGVLIIHRMSQDGTRLLDAGVLVFDGQDRNHTIEGPKLYKRNGYYYIFAPAGGVESGWQLVLRSRSIFGPYTDRVVLRQGSTEVNGPHQGAWVHTAAGEDWFMHFQDRGPYGRVVHLQPMSWHDDWPVIGADPDGDGVGEPVSSYRKPKVRVTSKQQTPADSDEFSGERLGLQWQWHANPGDNWALPAPAFGVLRLYSVKTPEHSRNFWDVPNLLLQKFPGPAFVATAKVSPRLAPGNETGLILMGLDYAYLSLLQKDDGLYAGETIVKDADQGNHGTRIAEQRVSGSDFYFRVTVTEGAIASFSLSTDGNHFTMLGESFKARPGRWIGAKFGLFAVRPWDSAKAGYADYDWVRVE
jgi:beta-xylosidase